MELTRVKFVLDMNVTSATFVDPSIRLFVSPDESDNRFLECAEMADADYPFTGTKRYFPMRWKRTEMVNARELNARLDLR